VSPPPIRRARERDLERLVALFFVLLDHHAERARRLALRAGAEAEAQVRRLLAARLRDSDSQVLVWDGEGDLRGFCVARILKRPAIFAETERGEIEHLLVRESSRRRGVGRALAEAGLTWLGERGIRRAEVQVAVENDTARAFWRALGFELASEALELRLPGGEVVKGGRC
jgi:ribosomal protein S18 acetylase RimI-like enzyme